MTLVNDLPKPAWLDLIFVRNSSPDFSPWIFLTSVALDTAEQIPPENILLHWVPWAGGLPVPGNALRFLCELAFKLAQLPWFHCNSLVSQLSQITVTSPQALTSRPSSLELDTQSVCMNTHANPLSKILGVRSVSDFRAVCLDFTRKASLIWKSECTEI